MAVNIEIKLDGLQRLTIDWYMSAGKSVLLEYCL